MPDNAKGSLVWHDKGQVGNSAADAAAQMSMSNLIDCGGVDLNAAITPLGTEHTGIVNLREIVGGEDNESSRYVHMSMMKSKI